MLTQKAWNSEKKNMILLKCNSWYWYLYQEKGQDLYLGIFILPAEKNVHVLSKKIKVLKWDNICH